MNSNILIIGAARSGLGAAILAKSKGFNVLLVDDNPISKKNIEELDSLNIPYMAGNLNANILHEINLVVKSPGVPIDNLLIQEAKKKFISVIGEIEFASFFTKARLIGITGTNGKTTTTYLAYHILKSAGLSVAMAGNVGRSFASAVMTENPDYFILELSSFQLDDVYRMKLDIACMLNITPDHLDRYVSMKEYIAAKFRVLQNMTTKDHFIYNASDSNIAKFIKDLTIFPKLHQLQTLMCKYQLPESLMGTHNKMNAAVAINIARILNINDTAIQKALKSFTGVPHRMQKVKDIDGIVFYNDSKATNIDSARVALQSFDKQKIVWIAGGCDKGNDYATIFDLVQDRVKAIVCLTKDYEKIMNKFSNILPIYTTQCVSDAVDKAFKFAKPGDVVLLSPACASFDLFNDYEDRGNKYMKAVCELRVKIRSQ